MDGNNISAQSFRRKVGTGSKRHDFVGEFFIIFSMPFSETSLKCNMLGGKSVGGAIVVVDAENVSWIFLIFLVKQGQKVFWSTSVSAKPSET